MREIRIAIVSKRIALSRFFALEAERFGFEVTTFDKAAGDLSAFDMCILDTEGMRHLPSVLARSVVLIADGASGSEVADSGMIRLGYPASIRDIDAIYASLLLGGEVENKKEKETKCRTKLFQKRNYAQTNTNSQLKLRSSQGTQKQDNSSF